MEMHQRGGIWQRKSDCAVGEGERARLGALRAAFTSLASLSEDLCGAR